MQVTQLVNLVAEALVVEPKKVAVPVQDVPIKAAALDGYRILVIDDEPDFVTYVSTVLEDNGATVMKAYSGEEGIDLARKETPHLMTLDINMPGKSGMETFEDIRNDKSLQLIPVCIITGTPELRKLIYDRPVTPPDGYLDKPITEEDLLTNVRRILAIATQQQEARK
jgi:CheY-like chemotaxis protein